MLSRLSSTNNSQRACVFQCPWVGWTVGYRKEGRGLIGGLNLYPLFSVPTDLFPLKCHECSITLWWNSRDQAGHMERCKIRLLGNKIILTSVRSSFRAQGVYSLCLGLARLKLPHSIHQKPSGAFPERVGQGACRGRESRKDTADQLRKGLWYYLSLSLSLTYTYIFIYRLLMAPQFSVK